MNTAVPKNCTECKYNNICCSYYGGSLCKHKDAISEKEIKTLLGKQN